MPQQPNLEDYLQKGMYGEKQLKPDEKRKYLGTFRERVVIALEKSQVMESQIYSEVEDLMKKNPKAKVLLNGDLTYTFLTKYIQLAKKHNHPYSIVTNKDSNTPIGLVLALDYAINKENIYITKETEKTHQEKETIKKEGLWSSLKGVFIKKK
ncbi:YueI family protein [Heyndrickxia vini]|uniref:YueI family protein n=1 Tax=Heyndrickxia vini TaxID=1476025 RepID=A0ABX7E941_9BACI|nr:YueI family protein [Heyndrickxia vini]QQZ10927.1 YueI family protein [Heyndrickxia vini]